MLILTRKPGEIIHIGNDIQVVVKGVSGKTVRLGVIAPSEVPILRQELLKQEEPEGQESPQLVLSPKDHLWERATRLKEVEE